MLARAVEEQLDVARRWLSAGGGPRRSIRDRGDAGTVVEDDVHGNTLVRADVHAFGPVEAIELGSRQEMQHAADGRAFVRLDVRDAALARSNRQVEAETITVEPAAPGRERPHATAPAEGRVA